jgi:predicted amidophosphoribosyltransferase
MEGFFKKVKRGAEQAALEADKLRRTTALKGEIGGLQGKIKQHTRDMGTKALELFDAGQLTQPDLLAICEQIATLRAQIAEREKEIEAIQREMLPEEPEAALYGHICPQCRIRLPDEARFCPRCGGPAADVPPPTLPEAPAGLVCSHCGGPLTAGAIFCPHCGTKAEAPAPAPARACASCGAALVEGAAFCPECGTPVETREPSPTIEEVPEAEADLEEGAESADDEGLSQICDSCGTPLVKGAAFCPECGTPVTPPELEPTLAAVEQERGEEEVAQTLDDSEEGTQPTPEEGASEEEANAPGDV